MARVLVETTLRNTPSFYSYPLKFFYRYNHDTDSEYASKGLFEGWKHLPSAYLLATFCAIFNKACISDYDRDLEAERFDYQRVECSFLPRIGDMVGGTNGDDLFIASTYQTHFPQGQPDGYFKAMYLPVKLYAFSMDKVT